MTTWFYNEQGYKEFRHGKEAWEKAAFTASNCRFFKLDEEDELLADEEISCYNCRYRRWTGSSFVCLKI